MAKRIYNAIILLDEPGGRHFCSWVRDQVKRIETRMKNMIPEGDLIICCSKGSMTKDRGLAVCLVHAAAARPMVTEDEKLACIECIPGRWATELSNWRYFSRKFEFTRYKVGGTYQAMFSIKVPENIQIIENTISVSEEGKINS